MSASTHLAEAGAARGTAWSTAPGSEPALVTRRTPVTRIFSPNLASFHPLTLPDFGLHPLRALPWSRMTCPFSPPDRPSIAAKTLLPCGARTHAQCHLVFAKLGIRHNWGADPLVRAGRPRPALLSKNQALVTIDKPARGPAADEGVRPTIYAGGRNWEN